MKFAPYSAHKINVFEDCPKNFEYKYVKKIKGSHPPVKFFEKGRYIHKMLEHYPAALPKPFKFRFANSYDIIDYNNIMDKLPQNVKDVISKSLNVREHNFKIFEKYTMEEGKLLFRGTIDFIGKRDDEVMIIDWKTGRVYESTTETQLKIYALYLFLRRPNINTIKCSYYYIEHDTEISYVYERKDLENIKSYFDNQINKIEEETDFVKKADKNCQYCDYFSICKPHNVELRR